MQKQKTPETKHYVLVPDWVHNEIVSFLGAQPFIRVEKAMIALRGCKKIPIESAETGEVEKT